MGDQRSVFVPFDLDTDGGANVEYVLGVNLRLSASGGSIEALGQKAMAASIPVAIASDQGALSVDSELATAAALSDTFPNPTTAPVGACLMGFDGTDWERIYSVADGDAVAAGTTGFLIFGTDGSNYQAIATDASGNVQVDIVSGAAGVSHIDDAAFTPGTDDIVPMGGMFDDTAPDSVDEGDAGVLRMSQNRNLYATLRDAAGNERGVNVTVANELAVLASAQPGTDIGDVTINGPLGGGVEAGAILVTIASDSTGLVSVDDNGGSLTVDNGGTFVVQEDGAALTALQLIDDIVAVLGTATYTEAATKGAVVGAVRNDTLASLVDTDNEIAPLQVNASGALYVEADTELPAAAALGDTVANPTAPSVGSHLMGYDRVNTDWTRVDAVIAGQASGAAAGFVMMGDDGSNYRKVLLDAAGHVQVDVLSGGGSDTPTNPVNEYETSADLAAGSSADLTTSEAASKKLAQVEVYCSLAYKVAIHTVDNAVESTDPVATGGGQAHMPFVWKPPHRNYVVLGATAGLDAFRVKITNLDDNLAADVYATFHFED